jgi:hypothetical protein
MTAARADLVPDSSHSHAPTAAQALPAGPAVDPTKGGPATVTDLTARIADRRIIDEAKRLLMDTGNLTEPEAHRWIQKTAMDRRTSKQKIAIGIIEALSEKN